jgi:prevent-host-death family protein
MDLSKDIRSLSDFKRNTSELMDRMEESGEPMVLTVNGKAKLIVQDAASYQKLLESIDYDQAVKGIRRGLDDVKQGRSRPAAQAFPEIRKQRRIPRNISGGGHDRRAERCGGCVRMARRVDDTRCGAVQRTGGGDRKRGRVADPLAADARERGIR